MHFFKKRILILLPCLLATFLPVFGRGEDNSILHIGSNIPPFSITLNDGRTIDTDTLKGKPAIIVFFHTGCIDCQKELPLLQKAYDQWNSQIQLICISRAENKESIEQFWNRKKLTIPYSAQPDRHIYHLFAHKGIPKIYITDHTGKVRAFFSEKVSKRKLLKAIQATIEFSKQEQNKNANV